MQTYCHATLRYGGRLYTRFERVTKIYTVFTSVFYVIINRPTVSTKTFVCLFWNVPVFNPCPDLCIFLASSGVLATVHNKVAVFHARLTIAR